MDSRMIFATFIIAMAVLSVYVYSIGGFPNLPFSLTGDNIYIQVTTPCGESFDNVIVYEYFNTFHDRPADYYSRELYRYDVPPVYGIRPSSYITSSGVMVCEDWKFYDNLGNPVPNYDFIYTYRYPVPNEEIIETNVDCTWISRTILSNSGKTIDNPVKITLGECLPTPPEPPPEPPIKDEFPYILISVLIVLAIVFVVAGKAWKYL